MEYIPLIGEVEWILPEGPQVYRRDCMIEVLYDAPAGRGSNFPRESVTVPR